MRRGRAELTLIDALLVAIVTAIAAAVATPLVGAAMRQAKSATLRENLHVLREQLAFYMAQHGGCPPVVYDGTMPQLLRATDAHGVPGERGRRHPYGPYLPQGMPMNPLTGRSIITATEEFPPKKASGAGGWLYHAATGQIAPDSEGFLSE